MSQNTPARVLVAGPYGGLNHGDDFILQQIAGMIRELGHIPIATSAEPEYTTRNQGISAVRVVQRGTGYLTPKTALNGIDVLVVGGGEQLLEGRWGNPVWGMIPNLYHLTRHARIRGVPIMFWSIGMPAPRTRIGAWMIRRCLTRADIVTVRDSMSLARIKQIVHPNSDKVHFAADPVFTCARTDRKRARQFVITHLPLSARQKPIILFAPAYDTRVSEEAQSTLIASVKRVADQIGAHILVKLMDDQTRGDRALLSRALLQPADNMTLLPGEDFSYDRLRLLFAGVDVTIASRMHALILSATQGTPWVNIARGTKMQALSSFFEVPWVSVTQPDAQAILNHTREALGMGSSEWVKRHDETLASLALSARLSRQRLQDLLTSKSHQPLSNARSRTP